MFFVYPKGGTTVKAQMHFIAYTRRINHLSFAELTNHLSPMSQQSIQMHLLCFLRCQPASLISSLKDTISSIHISSTLSQLGASQLISILPLDFLIMSYPFKYPISFFIDQGSSTSVAPFSIIRGTLIHG